MKKNLKSNAIVKSLCDYSYATYNCHWVTQIKSQKQNVALHCIKKSCKKKLSLSCQTALIISLQLNKKKKNQKNLHATSWQLSRACHE